MCVKAESAYLFRSKIFPLRVKFSFCILVGDKSLFFRKLFEWGCCVFGGSNKIKSSSKFQKNRNLPLLPFDNNDNQSHQIFQILTDCFGLFLYLIPIFLLMQLFYLICTKEERTKRAMYNLEKCCTKNKDNKK